MVKTEFRGVYPNLVFPVTYSGEVKANVLASLVNHLVSFEAISTKRSGA